MDDESRKFFSNTLNMNPFSKEEGFFCFKGFTNPFSEKRRDTFYNMIRNNYEISSLISVFFNRF